MTIVSDSLATPMILTNREHRECRERWLRWKQDHPDWVPAVKALFTIAEASVQAFGPHLDDVAWIRSTELFRAAYGGIEPLDALLDAMHFPPDSTAVVRSVYRSRVHDMILEHEQYGSGGDYMPRSVILGWIATQHDMILSND